MKSLLNIYHLSIFIYLFPLYTHKETDKKQQLSTRSHTGASFPRRNQDMEIVKLVKTHPSPNTPAII